MAQGESERHFYLPNEVAWSNLMHLQERYLQGWVTVYTNRHAWESILRVYLPDRIDVSRLQLQLQPGQTPQVAAYSVDAHPSDQGERDHGAGAGAILERIIMDLPARSVHRRDILYVKCSPPSDNDAQSQWNSAMKAAVAPLGQRHVTRALYFILGVGMEWLPFYWDPRSPAPAGKALRMAAGGGEGEKESTSSWYEVSPEVRPPPGIDSGHVDGEGVVRTDRAKSLDCFTVAPTGAAGEVPGLAFQRDLDFLEEFIGVVERHAYVGENDPDSE
ncbi:hypothetical protein SLS64_011670 [Diaporthe eres]|uniref:Uncharacterized protein n=1 Tax=Diaporthe eres TaxID=83184 RepID=A0ABR1NW25_DIAER